MLGMLKARASYEAAVTSRGNHESSMVRTSSEQRELVRPLQIGDVLGRS